jgi:hypothetical protein
VVKTTGMLAANDLEQRFSEGGISDGKKGGTASKMEEPIGGWAQPRGGPVSLQGIGRGLAWAGGVNKTSCGFASERGAPNHRAPFAEVQEGRCRCLKWRRRKLRHSSTRLFDFYAIDAGDEHTQMSRPALICSPLGGALSRPA